MKNLYLLVGALIFLTGATTLYLPEEAEALPAFARKFGVKCTTCHVQFPKLNAFGIAFKNRGYRMKGEEGDYIWDSKVFPIAAIGRFGYNLRATETGSGDERTNSDTSEIVDGGIELFSGGVLGPRVSYFVDALTVDNLALVQFDDILPNSALNIRTGIYNVDNYYLSHPRRLTESTYLVQLTGNRADNVTFQNRGVEFNGQFEESGFRYALGVGNDTTNNGSGDKFGKHYYFLLNKSVFDSHNISFLFRGDTIGASNDNANVDDTADDTFAFGGNVDLHYGNMTIVAGAYRFFGGDSQDFTEGGKRVDYKANSGVVEATYEFSEKLLALARYDWHDTLDSTASEEQYVLSLQYHLVPNVKLNLEYADQKINPGGNTNRTETKDKALRMNVRFGF